MKANSIIILLLLVWGSSTKAQAQVVSIEVPRPYSFDNIRGTIEQIQEASSNSTDYSNLLTQADKPTKQINNPSTWVLDKYLVSPDEDIRRYKQQKKKSEEALADVYKTIEENRIYYDFRNPQGEIHQRFESAFIELSEMLSGRQSLEITKAVALVENAYDPRVNYGDLKGQVQNLAYLSSYVLEEKGLPKNDNLAKLMSIFHVLADTTVLEVPGEERNMTFYPLLYDFEDAWGKADYSKMFVSKLLRNGTGNCTSLPRLFLMVAEEMNAEAYMAFAPQHSYVKFQDHLGEWHNIELTNQMFTTDDHIMEWGWVKSEAIRSGIYMAPISKKELIAQSMNELGMAHYKFFGNTSFTKKCASLALKYSPKSITGYQIQANYYTELMKYVAHQYREKGKTATDFNNDLKVREIYSEMNQFYQTIEDLGFSEVPEKLYNEWIKSMDSESNRQSSRNRLRQMLNSIPR